MAIPPEISTLLARLAGGDRRSIGQADAVAAQVLDEPELFAGLWLGLDQADPVLRMRVADALEKVTRVRPDWLAPFRADFIARLAGEEQAEVRWHLVQMASRLVYARREHGRVLALLRRLLDEGGPIVQASALEALVCLSMDHPEQRRRATGLVEAALDSGSPAVRARARKLLGRLRPPGRGSKAPPDFRCFDPASPEYHQALSLRETVLRAPLGLSLKDEDLRGERDQLHFGLFTPQGELLACVSAQPVAGDTAKLRQMAVAPVRRGRGLGRALLKSVERALGESGFRRCVLHARVAAAGFYQRLGYVVEGEPFIEVTIPHVAMAKNLE